MFGISIARDATLLAHVKDNNAVFLGEEFFKIAFYFQLDIL